MHRTIEIERLTALHYRLQSQTDKFPSSAFFEIMNSALTSSEADKKQAIEMGKGVYAFTLKNPAGETDSWHIDLRNKGEVGKGLGDKPDGMTGSLRSIPS